MRRSRIVALALSSALALTSLSTSGRGDAAPPDPSRPDAARVTTASASADDPRQAQAGPPRNEAKPADLVVRKLLVETTVDSDRDGELDVVRVVITRPKKKDVDGRRLATVVHASPYFSCCRKVRNHDVDVPLRAAGPDTFDGFLARIRQEGAYWARRGYAFARVASLGSNGSTGCPTIGDDLEAAGPVALVDWLNSRATARTADGKRVGAGWSTGDAGMIGTSYDGTLPNMAAATGVEGLKAIVPLSAISSWYDYYRQDGLVVAPGGYPGEDTDILARFDYTREDSTICKKVIGDLARDQDRATGDYNDFWAARNLLPDADQVTAAVLIGHGFGDTNVKPSQAAQWYAALRAEGVPTKIWWDQEGHGTYLPTRLVDRWFDHFLYGARNGVQEGPTTAVTTGERTRWYSFWPRPGSRLVPYTLGARGNLSRGGEGQQVKRAFTDQRRQSAAAVCRNPAGGHALTYRTGRLARGLDLSGTPLARLRLAFDRPAANVTAALCVTEGGRARLLTAGWADPQNVDSLTESAALVDGEFYDVTVRLQPIDRRLPDGSRVSLVVMGTDAPFTLRPPGGTKLTLDLGASDVRLPVVR